MHSEFRRLPVEHRERALHIKRQDHVNDLVASPVVFAQAPTTIITIITLPTPSSASSVKVTLTTTTPTIATPSASQEKTSSAVPSSASASASSSVLQTFSASSSQSQASTSTTSSTTTSSTSTHSATGPSSSSSSTSQSVVLITASPSSTTNVNNDSTSAASSQLSGGAIGGIIAASVIVSLALLIFMVRKTYLRRRQTRRVSWPNGNIFNDTKPLPAAPIEDFPEKPASLRNVPMSPFDAHGQQTFARQSLQPPIQRTQSPFTGYATPALPDPSYNNPMPTHSRYPTLNPRNPEAVVSMARVAAGTNSYPTPTPAAPAPRLKTGAEAFVNRAFVPSLPDELSVTGGERIHVHTLYDDGWALCANGRGEQGMVPQECLDQHVVPDVGDWRNARRSSSLNPDGRLF